MKAVVITSYGGPEVLQVQEVDDPVVGDGDVLIKVAATALNCDDCGQRKVQYPLPNGTSSYPGLECFGTVAAAAGSAVFRWKIGDEVCALLGGGGYAEKVVVPEGHRSSHPSRCLPSISCELS